MNKLVAALAGTLLVVTAACGSDDRADDAAACPQLSPDDKVAIDITWSGPWDDDAAKTAVAAWTASHPSVTATVRHEDRSFFGAPTALIGPRPPTVAAVSYAALPALVGAGAVRPIGDCLADAGVDFDAMIPAAVAKGDVGGARYGAPANNDTVLLLYDRAAFRAAGLDPERPPSTMAEVLDAARTLQRHGKQRPAALDGPQFELFGLDLDSPDARTAAQQWLTLFGEDLLTTPADFKGLPPVGSGAAAMQWVDTATLWGYADALAQGQAPAADLGVAPFPTFRHAQAPAGGSVWVVSTEANASEAAAAVDFIAWAEQPAQQAKLQMIADVLPSTPSARDDPELRGYWQSRPLLGEAFTVFTEHATTLRGWETTLGSFTTIIPRLMDVGRGDREFEATWTEITSLLHTLEHAQARDPAGLLSCLAEHVEDQPDPVGRVCPARA